MKKILIASALAMLVVATNVVADTVQIGYLGSAYGVYQAGRGGEFTVLPDSDLAWVLQFYDNSTKNVGVAGTFQTFCVEQLETINGYPATYAVVLNTEAVYGGKYPNGDPLSVGAAWLYHLFQNQQLPGYLWDTTDNRRASATDLQNALWFLEGEGGSLTAAYSTLLVKKFGSIANAEVDNNGQYPVMVMNLWDVGYVGVDGHQHQDLLVCVPDGGMTVVLLGMGLSCLAFISRRIRK